MGRRSVKDWRAVVVESAPREAAEVCAFIIEKSSSFQRSVAERGFITVPSSDADEQ
jgi:hypothetical protein